MITKDVSLNDALELGLFTQQELAEELNTKQPAISRLKAEGITDLEIEFNIKGYIRKRRTFLEQK